MGLREKKSFCSVENEFVKIISKLLLQIHVKHVGATKFALLSARLLTNNFNKQKHSSTAPFSTLSSKLALKLFPRNTSVYLNVINI